MFLTSKINAFKAFLITCCIVSLVSCTTKATGDSQQPQSPPCPWTLVYNCSDGYNWWEQTASMKVNGGTIYRSYLSHTRNGDPAVSVALVFVPDTPAK